MSKPGTSVLFRILVSLAGSKTARKIVNSYVGAAGALASRLGHDFVATVDFHPLFDAKLRMHLFSPDILFVLEVISQRSYDRFCGLREGDIVVDCGAYIGEFTTYASRRVGKKGRVYSFEPNPESFALLSDNVLINDLTNVETFSVALKDHPSAGHLVINRATRANTKVEEGEVPGGVAIPIQTLDSFTHQFRRPVKLLKLDVEGDACRILIGAVRILTEGGIQHIAMEAHVGEEPAEDYLESLGYKCLHCEHYLFATRDS